MTHKKNKIIKFVHGWDSNLEGDCVDDWATAAIQFACDNLAYLTRDFAQDFRTPSFLIFLILGVRMSDS